MKKILSIAAAAAVAFSCIFVLGACSKEEAKKEGNKIVSDAKSYLQSELGIDGDVSDLKSSVKEAVRDELGLNNTSNQVLEGNWIPVTDTIDDWCWTFDGKNKCTLKSEPNASSAGGTYSVNEDDGTVVIQLDTWNEPVTFTYALKTTLSDNFLKLSSETQGYNLKKEK